MNQALHGSPGEHSPRPRSQGPRATSAVNRLLGASALALALVACSSTQAPTESTRTKLSSQVATVNAQALVNTMLNPAGENAVPEALATLPQPLGEVSRSVPNRHTPGVTDRIDSLDFGNVKLEVYRPGGGGPLLSAVEVDTTAVTIAGLAVGMNVSELLVRFGRPEHATSDLVVFRFTPSASAPFQLSASLDDQIVTSLRWSAYLD